MIMSTQRDDHRVWSFGDFSLDVDRGSLEKHGRAIDLRPQSFEVLTYLIERHGRLVSKKELMETIWEHKAVTDDSLTHCLIDIRKALGDSAREMIRTVPRRGYIFEVDVIEPRDFDTAAVRNSGRWRFAAVVATVGILLAIWLTYPDQKGGGEVTGFAEAPDPRSIAVLPFVDMSKEGDQEYFAVGMSEEIINLLANIDDLRVSARTSSFVVADQGLDIGEIARRLNTTFVLEGSVRKSGQRIRVTAQLIDGASMAHIWSDTFDHELIDAIAVQQEIAEAVADVLHSSLPVAAAKTQSPAYNLYLRGKYIYNRRARGDAAKAHEYFGDAIVVDPEYAPAWAALAATYAVMMIDHDLDFTTGASMMLESAEKAVALDPDFVNGQLRLAQAYAWNDQRDLAEQKIAQVLAEHPNNSLALGFAAGRAARSGDYEKAVELQRRSVAYDPLNAVSQNNLAGMLAATGYYEEAVAANRKKLDLNPASIVETDGQLAHLFILLGRTSEALEIIRKCLKGEAYDQGVALAYYDLGEIAEANAAIMRLQAASTADAMIRLAEIHAHRGDANASFGQLQLAYESISLNSGPFESGRHLTKARFSPFLRPLRADDRWHDWIAVVESAIQIKIDNLVVEDQQLALTQ